MDAFLLGVLALASVGLWTLRMRITMRGLRCLASVLAIVEAVVYVSAFGRLIVNLGAVHRLIGFAVGVGIGTYLGMLLDDRLGQVRPRARRTGPRRTSLC